MPSANLIPEGLLRPATETAIKTKEESIFAFFTDPAHIGLIIVAFGAMVALLIYLYRDNAKLKKAVQDSEENGRETTRDAQIEALQKLVQTQIDSQTKAVEQMKELSREFRTTIENTTNQFSKALGEVHRRVTEVMGNLSELWGQHDSMMRLCSTHTAHVDDYTPTRDTRDRRQRRDRRQMGCPTEAEGFNAGDFHGFGDPTDDEQFELPFTGKEREQ